MGEDLWPGVVMALSGLLVGEAGVGEAELGAGVNGSQVHGDDGFGAFGGGGEPSQFDEAVAFEPQEAAVVGMALPLEMGLEKEGGVDFGSHQDRAGGGEPAIELFGPGAEERGGGCEN